VSRSTKSGGGHERRLTLLADQHVTEATVSATSEIEWTDTTWNPVRGCTKISPGLQPLLRRDVRRAFSRPQRARNCEEEPISSLACSMMAVYADDTRGGTRPRA
jgi:hypothetical protein